MSRMSIGEDGGHNRKGDSFNENGGRKLADAQRVRFGVLASRQDSQSFVETVQKEGENRLWLQGGH